MNKKSINVTVDTSVSPPKFTFAPDPLEIDHAKKEKVYWETRDSNFTFAALAFDRPNPFSNVVINNTVITADDDNQRKEDHRYIVLIKANGTYYSSKLGISNGGPTIRNK